MDVSNTAKKLNALTPPAPPNDKSNLPFTGLSDPATTSNSAPFLYAAVARRGSLSTHAHVSTTPSTADNLELSFSSSTSAQNTLPPTPVQDQRKASQSRYPFSKLPGKHSNTDSESFNLYPPSPPTTNPRDQLKSLFSRPVMSPLYRGHLDQSFASSSVSPVSLPPPARLQYCIGDNDSPSSLRQHSGRGVHFGMPYDSPIPPRARSASSLSSISSAHYDVNAKPSPTASVFAADTQSQYQEAIRQTASAGMDDDLHGRMGLSARSPTSSTHQESAGDTLLQSMLSKLDLDGHSAKDEADLCARENRAEKPVSAKNEPTVTHDARDDKLSVAFKHSDSYKTNISQPPLSSLSQDKITPLFDPSKANQAGTETRYVFVSGLPSMPDFDVVEMVEAFKATRALRAIHLDSNPAFHYRNLQGTFITRQQFLQIADGWFANKLLSIGEGKLLVRAEIFNPTTLEDYFRTFGDIKSLTLSATEPGLYHLEYFDDSIACSAFTRITERAIAGLDIGWEDIQTLNDHVRSQTHSSDLPFEKVISAPRNTPIYRTASPPLQALPVPRLHQRFPDSSQDTSLGTPNTSGTSDSSYPSFLTSPYQPSPSTSASVSASAYERERQREEPKLPSGFASALNKPVTRPLPPIPGLEGQYVPNDPKSPYGSNGNNWGLLRDDPIPANNVIHFDRIFSGQETRTSCILRNLPNRMTQLELMEVSQSSSSNTPSHSNDAVKDLDQVVPKEYDFIYLRFDFQSGSNCGFGFVNFINMAALVKFWNARLGKMWDSANSRKIVMGGFANIQGKAALIERFRNSSVMDQHPDYRPKVFWSDGPNKGLPEPFPVSNNSLRKARSTYATGMYGLYGSRPKGGFRPVPVHH
ncbi:hypothetical protein EMMF5_002062 [Cystobasidiomycetes sp. EMM_F5]